MNIRFDSDTIRFRLDPADVDQLAVSDIRLNCLGLSIEFVLKAGPGGDFVIREDKSSLQVEVPRGLLETWLAGHDIELDASVGPTRVLIEKDLKPKRRQAK